MLMQDGRNPYGSRGGYVRSDRRSDYEDDYAMRGNRDRRNDYGDYGDMARGSRRDRNDDYASYNDSRMRDRDYEDDYRRDYRNDYGKPKMFSHKDMETWKSMMKNEDGTRGVHFRGE